MERKPKQRLGSSKNIFGATTISSCAYTTSIQKYKYGASEQEIISVTLNVDEASTKFCNRGPQI